MSLAQDSYGLRALEFVERIVKCATYDEVKKLVIGELKWFGFDFVTIWSVPGAGREFEDTVLINTRPQDYIKHYQDHNYTEKDPVVTELRRILAPFSWSDLQNRARLSKAERGIISEARGFGADDGFLVPIVSASGQIAVFSPCGHKPDLSPRARSALEIIGIYSQQAAQRFERRDVQNTPRSRLTAREREVMKWVATGKSDDEIGEILNIAHATVTKHVENSKQKLNATRRAYAVVQALRYGELAL